MKELWNYLKEFCLFFVNLFFIVWAHSPIFPLTDDENYTNLVIPLKTENESKNNKNVRLSLFSLYCGEYAFFIISFNFSKKEFSFFKKMRMKDLPTFNDKEKMNRYCNEYNKHVDKADASSIQEEKEFLSKEFDLQTNRISRTDIKFTIYTAISLAMATLLSSSVYERFCLSNTLNKIIIGLLSYYFLNIFFLSVQYIGVQSVNQYKFENIINEPNENKGAFLLKKMYYNYIYKKNQARLMVSSICRVYDFLKIFIVILLVYFISSFVCENTSVLSNHHSDSKIFIFESSKLNMAYSEESISFLDLEKNLAQKKYNRVIVMSKTEIQEKLKNEIEKYEEQKISYLIDETLDNEVVKILLEN